MKNSALLSKTSEAWATIQSTFKKFNNVHNQELLTMMESKTNDKVSNSNNVKDLKLKDIFKLSECTFEDKVLEGYSEAVK